MEIYVPAKHIKILITVFNKIKDGVDFENMSLSKKRDIIAISESLDATDKYNEQLLIELYNNFSKEFDLLVEDFKKIIEKNELNEEDSKKEIENFINKFKEHYGESYKSVKMIPLSMNEEYLILKNKIENKEVNLVIKNSNKFFIEDFKYLNLNAEEIKAFNRFIENKLTIQIL